MSRWQFEQKYPAATTFLAPSKKVQERPDKFCVMAGVVYSGFTWAEVDRDIRFRLDVFRQKGQVPSR